MTLYRPARQSDSVIDVSHYQGRIAWPAVRVANPGLRGVICKASQGTGRDPMWNWNATQIGPSGLLPGAYHFVTGDSPDAQVETFLGTVQPVPGVLVALDWEYNPGGSSAGLAIIQRMVSLVEQRLGRLPVLYLGRFQLGAPNALLNRCDLWLPEYGFKPICPPGWTRWRLHQHTDGAQGDRTGVVNGIGYCDRSYHDDTQGDLADWWGR